MELPDEILTIIKDFSRPFTRPGWRKLRIMTSYMFHQAILYKYNRMRHRGWRKVIYEFVLRYSHNPQDKYIYEFGHFMDYERFVSVVQLKLNPGYIIQLQLKNGLPLYQSYLVRIPYTG